MKNKDSLVELVRQYDRLRSEAKQAEKDQKECGDMIKQLLGDAEEAPVPGYRVTYKYDKDKVEEVFDKEKMEKKAPEVYKAYQALVTRAEKAVEAARALAAKFTKTKTSPGARKLLVVAGEEE